MRFTMLDPRGAPTATATLEPPPEAAKSGAAKSDWDDPYKYGYEVVEAPWAFRYAQIGVGISSYFFISRLLVPLILIPFVFAVSDMQPQAAVVAIGLVMLLLYCLAALGGGAVAGFWARNWLPQGLGVAAGVLFIPLVIMLVFVPENWPRFVITLVLTSVMTIIGAYLGHILVKPTRIPHS
jgi:hypothetical protein